MTTVEVEPLSLQASFEGEECRLRVRFARIGAVLAILLVPSGAILDFLIYRQDWGRFLQIRLLCVLVLLPIAGMLYSRWAERFGMVLAHLLGIVPALAICGIIYQADGPYSSYYAGLMLIMIAVTQLLQSFREALFMSVFIIGSYAIACIPHIPDRAPAMFLVNLIILAMTGIVCVVLCGLNWQQRFRRSKLTYDLEAKQRQLTEMDQLKSQFFANVSHELRTPLTLILAPVETLLHRQPPLDQTVGQLIHLIRRNGMRLLALINDLLDIIRLEQRVIRLETRPLELAGVLEDLFLAMRDEARRKGIRLTFQKPDKAAWVLGDEMRLERVFLNLLSNAVKFTPGGGVIHLRLQQQEGWIEVVVQDSGIGIPSNELPRIFDRFYQVRHTAVSSSQGLGIGLHLAREVVRAHQGTITAGSPVGGGATFTVRLPAGSRPQFDAGAAAPQEDLTKARQERPTAAAPLSVLDGEEALERLDPLDSRPVVLVVDDEPDMRAYLTSILRERHQVLAASSAERGLELARRHPPDVVVLDLMLPGMDGLEACRHFQSAEMPQDLKIIMLTAKIDEGTKIAALRQGADDFLTKPFNSIEIRTRVEKLLEASHLQASLRRKNLELEGALEQLRQTESHLIQSEKMNALGRLAAGLLHEINNPLNYALVAVQLALQTAGEDQDLRETLDDIREGVQRVSEIISDLRTFAYPEQANNHQPFPLKEVIGTAKRFASHDLQGISLTLPEHELPLVRGSRTLVSQVLVNMLLNAVHAVRETETVREPEIRVEAVQHDSRITLHIRDNGSGIDRSVQPHIFDPFFTTKPEGQGIGLGLSVCHTILRQHGSDLRVNSVPGQGTDFCFTLPLAEVEHVDYD